MELARVRVRLEEAIRLLADVDQSAFRSAYPHMVEQNIAGALERVTSSIKALRIEKRLIELRRF